MVNEVQWMPCVIWLDLALYLCLSSVTENIQINAYAHFGHYYAVSTIFTEAVWTMYHHIATSCNPIVVRGNKLTHTCTFYHNQCVDSQ